MVKTKVIEVSSTDVEAFSEMSGMVMEIRELVKKYNATYEVDYYFKNE